MILGCYSQESGESFLLSKESKSLDDKCEGKLSLLLSKSSFSGKVLSSVIFYEVSTEHSPIIVVGLGSENDPSYDEVEEINVKKENLRCAMGVASKLCCSLKLAEVIVDDCGDAKATAEGLILASYVCDRWKSSKSFVSKFICISKEDETVKMFEEGKILAESQLFARRYAETPANFKYPSLIAQDISEELSTIPNVSCIIRNKEWIKSKKMELLLSVAQGSVQPPVLLEVHYKGTSAKPIVLVGKGITFDSGGISIKNSKNMSEMKADMSGGACVLASLRAAALMKLPLNIIAIVPFSENLPSGSATKPGDVFTSMNGITVEVDNTDAEGRLVLGDALAYAMELDPSEIMDLATLTGSMRNFLGGYGSGFFTHSCKMKKDLKTAAAISGDRMWHMPLYQGHLEDIKSEVADIINTSKHGNCSSSIGAAFLKKFVQMKEWTHIDIAGAAIPPNEHCIPYLEKGMTGRPTRAIYEYLKAKSF